MYHIPARCVDIFISLDPSGLSSLLRSMTQVEFSSTVSRVYKSLLNGIEGLQVQNSVLIDILESHM